MINLRTYNLQVSPITIGNFNDLGTDLTDQFKIFYQVFFTRGMIQLSQDFITESENVFGSFNKAQRTTLSDAYFNNFTPVTEQLLANKQYDVVFRLWTQILSIVTSWEEKNKLKLHKGTPYYFSAVSSLLQNDFDAAFMSMHNALSEDKLNNPSWDQAPGYFFLTLNDQKPNQYFKPFVVGMVEFIRDRLDGKGASKSRYKKHYHKTRSGSLSYLEFRNKFLDNKLIGDETKYYFVYAIIRIWHLRRLHKSKVGDSVMAPLIFTNALFSLLLVLDSLLKRWNNSSGTRWKFAAHLHELAKSEGWISSTMTIQQYMRDLDVANQSENNFDIWCKELIGYRRMQHNTLSGRSVGPLEADFILAYGLRNSTAHTIRSQEVLWKNYTEVLQAILNCIFKTNELL